MRRNLNVRRCYVSYESVAFTIIIIENEFTVLNPLKFVIKFTALVL